jgi:hypothetical protein
MGQTKRRGFQGRASFPFCYCVLLIAHNYSMNLSIEMGSISQRISEDQGSWVLVDRFLSIRVCILERLTSDDIPMENQFRGEGLHILC